MLCLVCKNEMDPNAAKCPRCGFPVIHVPDGDEAGRQAALEMAEQYRGEFWADWEILLEVRTNPLREGGLDVDRDHVKLADWRELEPGKILWYQESFARVSGTAVVLKCMVRRADETPRVISCTLAVPDTDTFWQVGVVGTETGFRLALGNPASFTQSKEITLL